MQWILVFKRTLAGILCCAPLVFHFFFLFGWGFFGFVWLGFFVASSFPLVSHVHCGTLRDGTSSVCVFTTSWSTPGTIPSYPNTVLPEQPSPSCRIQWSLLPIHMDHTGLESFTRRSVAGTGLCSSSQALSGGAKLSSHRCSKLCEEPGTLQATNLKMNGLVTQTQCWERRRVAERIFFLYILTHPV